MLLAALLLPAFAAEVTDLPSRGQVAAAVAYRGFQERGGLVEGGERVGERQFTQHDLSLGLAYAPARWAAVTLELVITPSMRWSYADARSFVFDPVVEQGSLRIDPSTEHVEYRAAGVSGMWLGLALGPAPTDRGTTTRVDVALRAPGGARSRWAARDNGVRGAAPGGAALRLGAAVSRPAGPATPFLQVRWTQELAATVPHVDEQGRDWSLVRVRPPSTVHGTAGAEIRVRGASTGLGLTVDGWLGGEYRTAGRVASGLLLPNVLDRTRTLPAIVDEQIAGRVGLGITVRAPVVGALRLGAHARWGTPYRIEHLYPVDTSLDTWGVGGSVRLSRVIDVERIVDQVERPAPRIE